MDRLLRRLLSEAGSAPKGDLRGRNPLGQASAQAWTQPSRQTTPGDPQAPGPGMNCDWELVAAYAEGQLGRAEREKLEDHLSQCLACRRMANAMLEERPEVAEAAEQRHAAGPWRLPWNWNWAVPALATSLIVGSAVFYQRDQILRHAAEDRAVARQVIEKSVEIRPAEQDKTGRPATAPPAGVPSETGSRVPSRTPPAKTRGSDASVSSRDREGAVAKSKAGQPTGGQLPSASPSFADEQTALSDKKEITGDIRTQTPNAGNNAVAEPSDKAEAARALNSTAPMNNAPQAAQTLPPRLQAIQPAANSGTYRRDAEAATGGAPPAAANAVGQMEERAAKALPPAAPLAAGAADSLDLAKKKTEVAQGGLRQTPAPKVAARSAAAPTRPERDSETPLKPAPQSVAAPPAAGLAGGVIGGIVGGQPQSFAPLPGGTPLRSWTQHDSRLWAVSDGGRLFRSEDGGRAWRSIPSPTTHDLVSVKWDAATNSLLLEDKQSQQYHAEP